MATAVQVVFDCADPGRLSRFWATALHYKLQDRLTGEDATVVRPGGEERGEYWVVMQDPEGNEFCVQ